MQRVLWRTTHAQKRESRAFERTSSRREKSRMYSCAVRGAPSKCVASQSSHVPMRTLLFSLRK